MHAFQLESAKRDLALEVFVRVLQINRNLKNTAGVFCLDFLDSTVLIPARIFPRVLRFLVTAFASSHSRPGPHPLEGNLLSLGRPAFPSGRRSPRRTSRAVISDTALRRLLSLPAIERQAIARGWTIDIYLSPPKNKLKTQ